MDEAREQEMTATQDELFAQVETRLHDVSALPDGRTDPALLIANMILHYGRMRKWLQTTMDVSALQGQIEAAEFIRNEVGKVDAEISFEKDER